MLAMYVTRLALGKSHLIASLIGIVVIVDRSMLDLLPCTIDKVRLLSKINIDQ
jgi:hypothetical protein